MPDSGAASRSCWSAQRGTEVRAQVSAAGWRQTWPRGVLELPLKEARAEFEYRYMQRMLEAYDGNRVQASRMPGMCARRDLHHRQAAPATSG